MHILTLLQAFKSFFAMQKENNGGSKPVAPEDKSSAKNPTRATVIQFAGCHDTQTSADAHIGLFSVI